MVRANNEDNFFADGVTRLAEYGCRPFSIDAAAASPLILAVCDGMGGEEYGETAPRIAVQGLSKLQDEIKAVRGHGYKQMVQGYINAVNGEISSCGKRSGTTLAMAMINEKSTCCFSIGDSRIYMLKNGMFSQISVDHTQGAEIAGKGFITAEQARLGKGGNKLTRCIGIGNCHNVDEYASIGGKCRLLICSDGLTDMLSDHTIKQVLSEYRQIAEAADTLLCNALNAGGKDNITIIAADIIQTKFFCG